MAASGTDEDKNDLLPVDFSRRRFLRFALMAFAASALNVGVGGCVPERSESRQLTGREHSNILLLGDFFLEGYPVKDFDIAMALERMLYGGPAPHPNAGPIRELVAVPSSLLAALYFDRSLLPLSRLDAAARKERLLRWRESPQALARGIYSLMHTLCMTLASSDPAFQTYTGYAI